jgi:uncharacterized protein YbaR (Trm112 family)
VAVAAQERRQPWTTLICSQCNDAYPLSTRNAQRLRSEGREPLCPTCRYPIPVLSDEERRKLQAWWLERLPVEELAEIAWGIWA